MVTAEDNKDLLESNAAKKEKLKIAKANLVEMQRDIGTLAPLVERGPPIILSITHPHAKPYPRLPQS